jgi:hypothetical protein
MRRAARKNLVCCLLRVVCTAGCVSPKPDVWIDADAETGDVTPGSGDGQDLADADAEASGFDAPGEATKDAFGADAFDAADFLATDAEDVATDGSLLCDDARSCESNEGRDTGPVPPPACDVSKPFQEAVGIALGATINDMWNPRLSADELSMYFTSGPRLYVATRLSAQMEFGHATVLLGIQPVGPNSTPSITADGETLFFRGTLGGSSKIFMATRTSDSEDFSNPVRIMGPNSPDDQVFDGDPYVVPDGRAIYFVSDRSGNYDLFRAEAFGAPIALTSLNSDSADVMPVVTPDELTIFFASHRPGSNDADIYEAHRESKSEQFRSPIRVKELSTLDGDAPGWISPDGCTLYMHRKSASAFNNYVLVATRPK